MESNRFDMSRRNFVKLSGAAGILSVAGLAGCGSGSGSAGKDKGGSEGKLAIGSIGPITGAAAIYGSACKNGAQVAIDELGAKGGSVQFDFNFQDDEGDPEKAVNAYNNLKDWGMKLLVGATTTASCVAVSSETNSDNVFQVTPSASSTDVIGGQPDADGNVTTPRKKNVFQMCFTDPNQGTASAQYIAQQKLGKKIAIFYNNGDAYSTGIYKKFAAEAAKENLEIVSTSTFTDDSATDFSVQVNDAKTSGADLVFLPIYYSPASLYLKQAKDLGLMNGTVKFFGCDGLDGILTLENFDKTLAEGVMLLTPFTADATDDVTKKFVEAYKKSFDGVPNQFAADAYDCVMMLAQAVEKAGLTGSASTSDVCDKLIPVITSSDFSYTGLTGKDMSWKDTGEVSKQPKGMIIKNGAYVGMDA